MQRELFARPRSSVGQYCTNKNFKIINVEIISFQDLQAAQKCRGLSHDLALNTSAALVQSSSSSSLP